MPPFTTFHGLYDRAAVLRLPAALEPRRRAAWSRRRTWTWRRRYNFVSTADIIGGNSGSPVINREGEFVGIIFDGNIQSLALDYFYTEEQARAVAVDARGILEALRKVYDAEDVVEELTAR